MGTLWAHLIVQLLGLGDFFPGVPLLGYILLPTPALHWSPLGYDFRVLLTSPLTPATAAVTSSTLAVGSLVQV